MSSTTSTTTESRALSLLGKGIPPAAVASALGVDPSRITQLLADEGFAAQVVEEKFQSLSKHATRDLSIDALEDLLLEKLKDSLPFMTRPMEILKSFSVINAAKRRALGATTEVTTQQTIVQLNIPSIIVQKFSQNIHNQVTAIGQQSLITIQSSQLLKQSEVLNDNSRKDSTASPPTSSADSPGQDKSTEDARISQSLLKLQARHNSVVDV